VASHERRRATSWRCRRALTAHSLLLGAYLDSTAALRQYGADRENAGLVAGQSSPMPDWRSASRVILPRQVLATAAREQDVQEAFNCRPPCRTDERPPSSTIVTANTRGQARALANTHGRLDCTTAATIDLGGH
jgi:hypothetical protein